MEKAIRVRKRVRIAQYLISSISIMNVSKGRTQWKGEKPFEEGTYRFFRYLIHDFKYTTECSAT